MLPHLRLQQNNNGVGVAGDWTMFEDGKPTLGIHRFKGMLIATRPVLAKWNLDGKGMSILRNVKDGNWKVWDALAQSAGKAGPIKRGAEALVFMPHYKRLAIIGTLATQGVSALTLSVLGELYGFRGDLQFFAHRPFYGIGMETLDLSVDMAKMPEDVGDTRLNFLAGAIV